MQNIFVGGRITEVQSKKKRGGYLREGYQMNEIFPQENSIQTCNPETFNALNSANLFFFNRKPLVKNNFLGVKNNLVAEFNKRN